MTRLKDFADQDWQNSQVNRVGNWSVGKASLVVLAVFLVLGLGGAIIGTAAGWWGEAQRQVSVTNVKAQWQFAYDYKTSMEAIGQQWCSIKGAEVAATDPTVKDARTSQRLAIEMNYSRVAGQYNAGVENAFKAKYIKPSDVPQFAPSLADQVAVSCPSLTP